MRETPLCTSRHMTRDEDQNHTNQVPRAQHVLECYDAAVPIETIHSGDGHCKFTVGLLPGVTVGTNMKTDLRESARRHESIHAKIFIAALSTRTTIARENLWLDYTWIGNDALRQSPENPE